MNACPTCPNRWIARLARSIGDEDLAREIEEAGCNNWKILREDIVDQRTMQVLETREEGKCMRDRMVSWFNHVSAQAHKSGETADNHRNVVAEGFSFLCGRPVVGDGASLPTEFREALEKAGVCQPLELPGRQE